MERSDLSPLTGGGFRGWVTQDVVVIFYRHYIKSNKDLPFGRSL